MKSNMTRVILNASGWVVLCCGQLWSQVTNIPYSSPHTCSGGADVWHPGADDERQIEVAIARAPEMMLSRAEDVGSYIDKTCASIAKLPDVSIRYRYYRAFMEQACATHFETIDSMVPSDRPELNSALYRYDRQQEVEVLRLRAWGCLSRVAEQIWTYLWTEPMPAPGVEQFEPYFKLITKLQSEERRLGRGEISLVEAKINVLERLILFTYLHDSRKMPDTQDRVAVEARFKQVVGRPIRSVEQYKADAQRRTEVNVKGHREQREAKRGAIE